MTSRFEFPQHSSPMKDVSTSASMLFDNAFELAELQLKLARLDVNIFTRRALHVAWMLPIAIGFMLAGLPILGFALAGTLVATLDISMTAAQWSVGITFVLLSMILAGLGAYIAMRAGRAFRRSQRELEKNVRWLRQMVVGSSPTDYQTEDRY